MDSVELELRSTFLEEGKEIALAIEKLLLLLESSLATQDDLETLDRYFHNLKGSARAVGLTSIAKIAHQLETEFGQWKKKERTDAINLFHLYDALVAELDPKRPTETLRVSIQRLNELINILEDTFTHLDVKKTDEIKEGIRVAREYALAMRMVPVRRLFQKMEKVVREVSGQLNKKVELRMDGGETELDRALLEQIQDPVMHLIHNALDHGIDNEGRITLKAYHQNNRFVLECHDDGRGIDRNKVLKKALEKGWVHEGQELNAEEWLAFLFRPGFTTKETASSISGRGIGLDVVKATLSRLNATIDVQSELGRGTTFRLTLPLVLSMVEGWVIETGGQRYVVPLSQVERVGCGEDDAEPLETFLELEKDFAAMKMARPTVMIRCSGMERRFSVESLVGPQTVVCRPFGKELTGAKGVSGGALLSDGKLALILDFESMAEY